MTGKLSALFMSSSRKRGSSDAKKWIPASAGMTQSMLKLGIFFISFVLTTLALVIDFRQGLGAGDFVIGAPAPRSLFAPFALSFIDEKSTAELRSEKSSEIPSVYRVSTKALEDARQKIDSFVKAAMAERQQPPEVRKVVNLGLMAVPESTRVWVLNEAPLEEVSKNLEFVSAEVLAKGLLADEKKRELVEVGTKQLTVQSADQKTESVARLADIARIYDRRGWHCICGCRGYILSRCTGCLQRCRINCKSGLRCLRGQRYQNGLNLCG